MLRSFIFWKTEKMSSLQIGKATLIEEMMVSIFQYKNYVIDVRENLKKVMLLMTVDSELMLMLLQLWGCYLFSGIEEIK